MIDDPRPPTAADPTGPDLDRRQLTLRTIRQMYRLMPSEMFAEVMMQNGVSTRRVILALSITILVYLVILSVMLVTTYFIPWWEGPALGAGALLVSWEVMERR